MSCLFDKLKEEFNSNNVEVKEIDSKISHIEIVVKQSQYSPQLNTKGRVSAVANKIEEKINKDYLYNKDNKKVIQDDLATIIGVLWGITSFAINKSITKFRIFYG